MLTRLCARVVRIALVVRRQFTIGMAMGMALLRCAAHVEASLSAVQGAKSLFVGRLPQVLTVIRSHSPPIGA
jgi:hypothetical protein